MYKLIILAFASSAIACGTENLEGFDTSGVAARGATRAEECTECRPAMPVTGSDTTEEALAHPRRDDPVRDDVPPEEDPVPDPDDDEAQLATKAVVLACRLCEECEDGDCRACEICWDGVNSAPEYD